MNGQNPNNHLEKTLQEAAEKINPNPMFAGRLEGELKRAHKPRKPFQPPSWEQAFSFAASAAALAAFAVVVVFFVEKILPQRAGSAPKIQPTSGAESAPALPALPAYERGGITVYLGAKLPPAPETMAVYKIQDERMATIEDARALARQFKMSGEIYQLAGQSGDSGALGGGMEYLAVDGNRQLRIRSDKYFDYYPDYVSWVSNPVGGDIPAAEAESAIRQFMQEYGFDFKYKIEKTSPLSYAAVFLSPKGFPMRGDSFQFAGLQFQFNREGLAMVGASLLKYEAAAEMEIISAEEAFQKALDVKDPAGTFESGRGGFMMSGDKIIKPEDMRTWTRDRPLDKTMVYNGWMSSTGKSADGGAPLVLLDGYRATGSVEDIPADMQNTYVEARGRFREEDGAKVFEIDSWKIYDGHEEYIMGTLRREGDAFVLDALEETRYILFDVPDDVPLPFENAYVSGILRGDVFDWKFINNVGGGGGGGGGGGAGFYKINFSGTPVVFTTPITQTVEPESAPQPVKVEGMRGTLSIRLEKRDGEQTADYLFIPYESGEQWAYLLQGAVDETLDGYHNRPIDVWGAIDGFDQATQTPILRVERYKIPYPDLQFRLITGEQRQETLDGEDALLIRAEDGETYIALQPYGKAALMPPMDAGKPPYPGNPNEGKMTYEALIVPGETLLGYPGMRVFNFASQEMDDPLSPMEITNDKPYPYEGPPPPSFMTIETVELVYFSYYQRYESSPYEPFMQPAWRFYGHYEDGSEFEIFVQALKREFLLPELDLPPMAG